MTCRFGGNLLAVLLVLLLAGQLAVCLGSWLGTLLLTIGLKRSAQAICEVAFTVGVIALGAKMAKADGVVVQDEIKAFKEVFKVPEDDVKNVARLFDLAKQDIAGFDVYAKQLASCMNGDKKILSGCA